MSGLPWSKFFWSDYAADPALKLCSFAAQGLWMRMLCIAAEHDPVGYVAVNGRGLDASGVARMTGGATDEVAGLVSELEGNGVFNRDRRGWIYSRRLLNDAKKSRIASENGKLGGNPTLRKDKENSGLDKLAHKPRHKRAPKPQKPEARRTLSGSAREVFQNEWKPEPFGDGEAAQIVAGWSEAEFKRQFEGFRDHHLARGSKFDDWQAAWGTWVRNSARFAERDRGYQPRGNGGGGSIVDQVLAEKEREERRMQQHTTSAGGPC